MKITKLYFATFFITSFAGTFYAAEESKDSARSYLELAYDFATTLKKDVEEIGKKPKYSQEQIMSLQNDAIERAMTNHLVPTIQEYNNARKYEPRTKYMEKLQDEVVSHTRQAIAPCLRQPDYPEQRERVLKPVSMFVTAIQPWGIMPQAWNKYIQPSHPIIDKFS